MKLIVIDIGNTNVDVGFFTNSESVSPYRTSIPDSLHLLIVMLRLLIIKLLN